MTRNILEIMFIMVIVGAFLVTIYFGVTGIYQDAYGKGYETAMSEIDKRWELYYDPDHMEHKDGWYLICDMPYEGEVVFGNGLNVEGRTVKIVSVRRNDYGK